MAPKNRSSGCETDKRTSSIRNHIHGILPRLVCWRCTRHRRLKASYSVHRMRRCEGRAELHHMAAWARERMESAARALQVWVGLRGWGAIYDPPLLPLHYTCDEMNIWFNLLRLRFRSSCCTKVFKMSKWCDQVWLTWIGRVFHVQVLSFMRTDIFYNLGTIIHFPLAKGSVFLLIIEIIFFLSWLICKVLRLVWCRTGGGHVQWRRLVCYVQPYLDTPRKLMMLDMQIKP